MPYWLLVPHGLAAAAFVGAFAAMHVTGTNRSDPDRWLGVAGYALSLLALLATAVMLFLFPYKAAVKWEWAAFAAHFLLLIALAVLGVLWIAFHLA